MDELYLMWPFLFPTPPNGEQLYFVRFADVKAGHGGDGCQEDGQVAELRDWV